MSAASHPVIDPVELTHDLIRQPSVTPADEGAMDMVERLLTGEVVLVEDDGETVLRAGDCAGFKAGVANGHKIENRSGAEAVLLEVGTRSAETDACDYPDIDMVLPRGADRYFHRDGTPYPKHDRRT